MKLHLPKVLCAALLAACSMQALAATNPDATVTVSGTSGNMKYDVGLYNKENDASQWLVLGTVEYISTPVLLSDAKNTATYSEASLTLGGEDKLGAFDGDNLVTSFSTYSLAGISVGKYSGHRNDTKGTVSYNFRVTDTLTIKDNAQVVLGGQVTTSSYAEYAGVIANKVVVDGYDAGEEGYKGVTNLNTWNLTTDVLEVKGGNVAIHNAVQSGNNHFVYEVKDSKQVRIHKELNIQGGTTVINLNSLDKNDGKVGNDTHIFTGFGTINFDAPKYEEGSMVDASKASIVKSWINQSAGTLTVNGKTASVGGLNINQTGGMMSISTGWDAENKKVKDVSWHILSDFGDSTIITDAADENTVLNIGGIAAYNSKYSEIKSLMTNKGVVFDPANQTAGYNGEVMDLNASVSIEQKGKGTINIINGFDLNNYHENSAGVASSQLSTITQSGTGIINMGGEYKGVTFDITQSGNGELNLNGSMNVNELTQTEGAGTITVAEGKTLNVNKMKLEGGVFINNGTVNGPMASQVATLAEEGDISTTTDAEATFITIAGGEYKNFGTTNADILVDGGTLTLENGSSVGNIEMKSGSILVTNDKQTATVGSITLSGGSITFEADAQLTLQTGAVVELGEGVEVIVQMSADALAALEAGSNVTLFDAGTNTVEFNNTLITFKDDQNNEVKATVTGNTTGGNVTVNAVVPEPTTATLSLLALAALASRRRRK